MWVKGVLSQQKETSQISVLEVSCVESPQAVRNALGKQWALDNWVTLGDWSDSHGAWLTHSTRSERVTEISVAVVRQEDGFSTKQQGNMRWWDLCFCSHLSQCLLPFDPGTAELLPDTV